MKKIVIVVLILGIGLAAWLLTNSNEQQGAGENQVASNTEPESDSSNTDNQSSTTLNRKEFLGEGDLDENSDLSDEGLEEEEARPAYEVYKSADEALEALKKGAADYDDLVLEQFTDLGKDCSWCDPLYESIIKTINSADATPEQRSYYAEVLAISGRLDNIEALVEQIKSAQKSEDADIYAEALELTVGKDDVVKYLSTQLTSDNAVLKEASVAAITNQGSKLAVDALFKHVIERGDPDGYYSQGIGPGELIPDEEALPVLQDYLAKRDGYSHLAAKAMLNNGINGLKRFFDILESSNDDNFDLQLINGLEDHVPYEEAAEAYLKDKVASAKSAAAKKFAEKALADFNLDGQETGEEE
jgi:hypothetical protein